ncbi:MAG: carbohydrate ABC transporter permease [Candidatus Wallbacteria bacterium]
MKKIKYIQILIYSLLIIWAGFTLFPLAYMFYSSMMPPDEIKTGSIDVLRNLKKITFENYRSLFESSSMFLWFVNSLIICGFVTVLQLLLNGMAGYALAKKKFALRDHIFWLFIAVMMVPSQIVCIPTFIMICDLRLIDTYWAVILPALVSPFGVFMIKQYMETLPDEILDAARVDGCSELGMFFKIVVPMSFPVFATLGIFVFISTWNSFLWPLLVLFSENKYTLSVGLATLQGQHTINYGLLMAGAAVSAIPIFLIFMFFSKYIIKGATEGAVKG